MAVSLLLGVFGFLPDVLDFPPLVLTPGLLIFAEKTNQTQNQKKKKKRKEKKKEKEKG